MDFTTDNIDRLQIASQSDTNKIIDSTSKYNITKCHTDKDKITPLARHE